MNVHNKGHKSARYRAVLIHSYRVMCADFHVPRRDRLDTAALARLSNEMLYKITKDMYSQATVKQAKRLAIKMGLAESELSRRIRLVKAAVKGIFKPTKTVGPKEASNG